MIFSKTDAIFERASLDESARKALIQKLKKTRTVWLCVFCFVVAFLVLAAIFIFSQIAPILRGDYASFDPSLPINRDLAFVIAGLSAVVGVFSIMAAVDADHRIKMLILIDNIERKLEHKIQAEQDSGGQQATRPEST